MTPPSNADRLRAEVYVLEGTIATLLDDVEGWRAQTACNDPVPLAGQLVCAEVCSELVAELTERLTRAKAATSAAGVELWDPSSGGPFSATATL